MKYVIAFSLVLTACSHASKTGAPPAVECFGDRQAKRHIVYLHGMDVPEKSQQERENREIILRIAKEIGASVSIPRAKRICQGDSRKICWGWKFDDTELSEIRAQIEESAKVCGAPPVYDLVGFSNGGYALNGMFDRCMFKPGQNIISIGAGNRPFQFKSGELSNCGELSLLVGQFDNHNSNGAEAYVENLRSRGANAMLRLFQGAHGLDENLLRATLNSD